MCYEIRKFGEFRIETGSRLKEGSGKSWSRTGLGSGIELGSRLGVRTGLGSGLGVESGLNPGRPGLGSGND